MRDEEINRLNVTFQGGSSFANIKLGDKSQEQIQSQSRQIDFLNRQNQELLSEMNEIKELVGICESKDPTDVDRFHLKTLVKKLKQRNETLQSENQQMSNVIETLKQGNFNESAGAKMIFE